MTCESHSRVESVMSADMVASLRKSALMVGVADEAQWQRLHTTAAPDRLPETSYIV